MRVQSKQSGAITCLLKNSIQLIFQNPYVLNKNDLNKKIFAGLILIITKSTRMNARTKLALSASIIDMDLCGRFHKHELITSLVDCVCLKQH